LPSESEFFLFGKTEGRGPAGEVARQDYNGSYGYVME
jgi:pilus assembly protein CpaC